MLNIMQKLWLKNWKAIALYTIYFSHLHHSIIQHVCEAISSYFVVLAQNCLAYTLDHIVMQLRKTNYCEKGYFKENTVEVDHFSVLNVMVEIL